ncbi:MAG: regulatory protein RecX [Thermodesulfobacteriota bacterium]
MTDRESQKPKTSVKAAALRLLSFRARSERELTDRLKEKSFDISEIRSTVDSLISSGLINDEEFARSVAASRVRNKFWGSKKIAYDLTKKGIARELINKAISEVSAGGEEATARKALGKWLRFSGLKMPLKEKNRDRGMRHLASKGFPSSVIFRVIDDIIDDDI